MNRGADDGVSHSSSTCCTPIASTDDDHAYSLLPSTCSCVASGSAFGSGRKSSIIDFAPSLLPASRTNRNVEYAVPVSTGSFTDAVGPSTRSKTVRTPGASHSDQRCHVAALLVRTCTALRRSKYALLTIPCRPGPTPVSADVWFTRVTDGHSAPAPPDSA